MIDRYSIVVTEKLEKRTLGNIVKYEDHLAETKKAYKHGKTDTSEDLKLEIQRLQQEVDEARDIIKRINYDDDRLANEWLDRNLPETK